MSKVKFIKQKTNDPDDKFYILIAEHNGKKIAFDVDGIK
jgi:hypothetical protein